MADKKYYREDEIVFAPMPKHRSFIDLTGRRYGKLKVLGYAKNGVNKFWFTKCDCGSIIISSASGLANGSNSCGCTRPGKIK